MKAIESLIIFAAAGSACWGDGPVAVSELRLDGNVQTTEIGYRGAVTVSNPTSHDISFGLVEFACAVQLEVYSSTDLVWDQGRDVSPQPGGCKWLPSDVTLRPGESIAVSSAEVSREILMAALQPGAYRAFVEVIFARMVPLPGDPGAETTQVDSVAVVPAGTLTVQ